MVDGKTLEIARQALRVLNPWWTAGTAPEARAGTYRRRLFGALEAHFSGSSPQATLVVGLRRIGKTTLVKQLLAAHVERLDLPPRNALYLDCQDSMLAGVALSDLYDTYAREQRSNAHPCIVAIDEVQYLENWHLQLRDLVHRTQGAGVHIVATGSNPGELRRASGRELLDRVRLFSLRTMSFGECLELEGRSIPKDAREAPEVFSSYEAYLFRGGFPALWTAALGPHESRSRVREICDRQVVDGDIASRLGVRNPTGFRKLWAHLVTHPGEELSPGTLAQGLSLGSEGIARWLEALLQVELAIEVIPTEKSGAALQGRKRHSRVFPADPAIASAYGVSMEDGPGLETVVLRTLRELSAMVEPRDPAGSFVGFWKSSGGGKSRDIDFRWIAHEIDLPISVKGARSLQNDDVARLASVAETLDAKRALLLYRGESRTHFEKKGVRVTAMPVLDFLLRAERFEGELDALLAD